MPKPYWSHLRTFHVNCASRDYECKRCNKTIYQGESYTGFVMVSINHKIEVDREHEFCEPDDPFDDDDHKTYREILKNSLTLHTSSARSEIQRKAA